MKKSLFGSAAALVSAMLAWQAAADCSHVRMAEPGWTDLALTTGIAATILEGLGYRTTSLVLGIPVIYESMQRGDLDVFLGFWGPAMEIYFDAFRDSGTIETVHMNLEGAKFTFAVPARVHDAGVTDFSHLAEHAEAFGRRMYGIEPGSNEIMLDIVAQDAFGLGDWQVVGSSEQGMLAQVARAERRGEWIVFLAWAPHPMNTAFDLRYLTGGDDFFGADYGGATVHTQVRAGYLEACTNVGRLLTQMTFDVEMQSRGMEYILTDGDEPTVAGARILRAQPELLDDWLAGVTTLDGGDAVAAVHTHLGL